MDALPDTLFFLSVIPVVWDFVDSGPVVAGVQPLA